MRTKTRHPFATATALVAAILLLSSAYLWLIGAGPGVNRVAPTPIIGGPFALLQADGRLVTDRDFRGKFVIIYFGYTSCRDICPATLTTLSTALDELGERAGRVQPLFITVDPARDTPPVMQRYIAAFTPQLVGLTGTPEAIRHVTDEYRVSTTAHPGPGPDDYELDHSAVLYLLGPDGRYLAPIRTDETSAGMAKTIGRYLARG